MRYPKCCFLTVLAVLTILTRQGLGASTYYGPTPYLKAEDSPFHGLSLGYFYLEDFEDRLLNTPGVSASTGYSTKPTFSTIETDSVDADDGLIDGSGNGGNSWFFTPGSTGITFTFDAMVLGSLPTYAGIVWTDGLNPITFQAFNAAGDILGTIGPVDLADGSFLGGTAEDRFFGVSDPAGIWKITINTGLFSGIEVDHLQYGGPAAVPVPSAVLLAGLGVGLISSLRRRGVC
jgi:hypothetical protein